MPYTDRLEELNENYRALDRLVSTAIDLELELQRKEISSERYNDTIEKYLEKMTDAARSKMDMEKQLRLVDQQIAATQQTFDGTSRLKFKTRDQLAGVIKNLGEARAKLELRIAEFERKRASIELVLGRLADTGYDEIERRITELRDLAPQAREDANEMQARLKEVALDIFRQARQEFIDWYDGEEPQIIRLVQRASDQKDKTDQCISQIHTALEKGDTEAAGEIDGLAESYVVNISNAADGAHHFKEAIWEPVMREQRNLKPVDFRLTSRDVEVHSGLTDQAYARMKRVDRHVQTADLFLHQAQTSRAQVGKLLAAGKVDAEAYEVFVAESKRRLEEMFHRLELHATGGWAKHIHENGTKFDKTLSDYRENPGVFERVARKTVEQGKAFLPAARDRMGLLLNDLRDEHRNEVQKIPVSMNDTLSKQIEELQDIVDAGVTYAATFDDKYDAVYEKLLGVERALPT